MKNAASFSFSSRIPQQRRVLQGGRALLFNVWGSDLMIYLCSVWVELARGWVLPEWQGMWLAVSAQPSSNVYPLWWTGAIVVAWLLALCRHFPPCQGRKYFWRCYSLGASLSIWSIFIYPAAHKAIFSSARIYLYLWYAVFSSVWMILFGLVQGVQLVWWSEFYQAPFHFVRGSAKTGVH